MAAAAGQLAGCASTSNVGYMAMDDRECLARVMYFESLRNSEEGMMAVGTVVMNRLDSGRYGNSVCGVIGQRNQFAPGALTRPMDGRGAALARKVAFNVLAGQRHPGLAKNVMFFHTYGYHYPYTNMHYVLVAGGNIFYFKDNRRYVPADEVAASHMLAYASQAAPQGLQPPQPVSQVAANEPATDASVPGSQPPEEQASAPPPPPDAMPTASVGDTSASAPSAEAPQTGDAAQPGPPADDGAPR